ncbi:Beta-glucanase [Arthrobotrys entomopaga]|nr:Beta-glucanase [Arthrobotrys entomopaga]
MQLSRLILIASSLLPAAIAQTSSTCNPLKGCFQDDPALGGTYTYDFTKNQGAPPRFDIVSSESRISYQGDGMHMSVQMKGDSPTLQSQFYIFWGRTEIVMKAGPGAGIVSSLVHQSDDLDEIDVEFIGNAPGNVQTNIFSKGNQDVHIYGSNEPVADATGQFHSYVVDWTPDQITWYIDGASVRVLTRASLGDVYPQTPMQIKFGPWAAGDPSNAPGTIEWAGGQIDYSQGPFDMVVQSLTITDYSTGASIYRYKDSSGSSGSIEIVGGGGSNVVSSSPPPPPPPTTTTTTTKKPDPTTTKTTTTTPPPPPPTTTTTTTPPPPPTTSKSTTLPPPPPPPKTTSTTTTSTSTTEEPRKTTSIIEQETKPYTTSAASTTSKPSTTSTSEKETTTDKPKPSTNSPSKSTFIVVTTPPVKLNSDGSSTTQPTATNSNDEQLTSSTNTPNSGSSVRAAPSLILAAVALFFLF